MARKKNSNAIINTNCKDEYFCWLEMKMKPMPLPLLERMASELIDWAENDKRAFSISQFYSKKRLSPHTWANWVQRCPALAEAQEVARVFLADRRETGAIEGKYNPATIMPYMSMFKKEYKDHAEWRASLQNKDKQDNETKIVVIERFPETNIVPTKKIQEKE